MEYKYKLCRNIFLTHNQKKLRIGIILFLLLINGLNTFAGTILGKVIDSYTHEVVPGAGVFIDKKTTVIVTGLNGNYQFVNLKPGNYIINAKSAGYENSVPQPLIINLNTDTINFDIYIKPKTNQY